MTCVARALREQSLESDDALEAPRPAFERDLDATHAPAADDEERAVSVLDSSRTRAARGVRRTAWRCSFGGCLHAHFDDFTVRYAPKGTRGVMPVKLDGPASSLRAIAAVAGCCASAVAIAASCIADLPPDAPPAPPGCGDGYIDLTLGEECDPGPQRIDASVGGCSARCKVVCSGLKWSHNDHCYEFAATAATSFQSQAVARCANLANTAHVVTFASESEFQRVATYASGADAGSFWVGIFQGTDRFDSVVDDEPGWSPECPGCYAHTVDPAAPLPSRVIAPDAGAICVEAFSDMPRPSWEQLPCDGNERIRVLCEREPVGVHFTRCDAGICIALVATQASKRYVYQSAALPPAQAQASCHDLGGTLVVLQSRDEREELWLELSRLPVAPSRFWVGVSADASDASAADADAQPPSWIWDDDASAADAYASPWGIRQPASPGQAFLQHFSADVHPVDDTLARVDPAFTALPFVCQIPLGDAGP